MIDTLKGTLNTFLSCNYIYPFSKKSILFSLSLLLLHARKVCHRFGNVQWSRAMKRRRMPRPYSYSDPGVSLCEGVDQSQGEGADGYWGRPETPRNQNWRIWISSCVFSQSIRDCTKLNRQQDRNRVLLISYEGVTDKKRRSKSTRPIELTRLSTLKGNETNSSAPTSLIHWLKKILPREKSYPVASYLTSLGGGWRCFNSDDCKFS